MITLQVVPVAGLDAYKLIRRKVTREARTWSWADRAKTRLRHTQLAGGYVKVASALGTAVLEVRVQNARDEFFLLEKLVGRLVAWFPEELLAINVQLGRVPDGRSGRSRKSQRSR